MVTADRLRSQRGSSPTILVFDSGLGGLTVLREIVGARPDAHYVYVADDAFFPYGHHGEEQIIARVVPLIGELIARHAPDLVVIACNTASTLVHVAFARRLQRAVRRHRARDQAGLRQFEDQARVGARHQGHRQTRIHQALIHDFAQGCEVTLVGSAELASLAEAALSGDDGQRRRISPPNSRPASSATATRSRTDTVVLACTHYPLLLDRLIRLAPWPVDWIDPAPAIARRVSDLLGAPGGESDQAGAEMIFTSKRPHTLSQALMPFFGGRVPA